MTAKDYIQGYRANDPVCVIATVMFWQFGRPEVATRAQAAKRMKWSAYLRDRWIPLAQEIHQATRPANEGEEG